MQLNALELQEKVVDAVKQVDDKLSFNDVIQYEDNLLKLYRETLLQCYNFGFEVGFCIDGIADLGLFFRFLNNKKCIRLLYKKL